MNCIVCNNSEWKSFYQSVSHQSVSSDCRAINDGICILQCRECGHLQKAINADYLQRVEQLYNTYQAYQLNEGCEHLTFTGEVPFTRSKQIISNVAHYITGVRTVLDIGCGSGTMLKALHEFNADLVLAGFDVSDHNQENIEKLPGVNAFYSGELSLIAQQFDLIVLSHVLEHITEPEHFLNTILELLSPDGILIIQVPNFLENPLDLFVYDHISHFTKKSLNTLLSGYFPHTYLMPKQIKKELTLFASKKAIAINDSHKTIDDEQAVKLSNRSFIENIEAIVQSVETPVYVFSTGPGGTLLGSMLTVNLAGFVDEDLSRVGKKHLNCPIYSPETLPNNALVILPFLKQLKTTIKSRLMHLNFIN